MSFINTHRIIPSPVSSGVKRLHVDTNDDRIGDDKDPLLVKMTDDGWQPVEQLDESVDRFTLEKDYGYWKDTEVSHMEGWPWNRRKVIDRPKNGTIEADELSFPQFQRINRSQLFELGGEIVKDNGGRLTLQEHYHRFAPRRIIGNSEINQLIDYRTNDDNWQVVPSDEARANAQH